MQCANRCFSKIFETIFLPCLSLHFQVQWKLPFPNFLFYPELFEVLFLLLLLLLFLFSIHCCWKSLFLYCVNLIEFILRDVISCHSLEFLNGIGNEESVENNIISHFWFCLPSPLKSPWPSDAAHFHKNFLALCYSDLWISWTCWVVYAIDAIRFDAFLILCFSIWTK